MWTARARNTVQPGKHGEIHISTRVPLKKQLRFRHVRAHMQSHNQMVLPQMQTDVYFNFWSKLGSPIQF